MKFIYIGNRETVSTYGYTFADEPVDVDSTAAKKLSCNPFFQMVEGEDAPKKRGRKPKTDTTE